MVAVTTLVILTLLLELAASVCLLVREGTTGRARLIQARTRHVPSLPSAASAKGRWEGSLTLHPLFGYVHTPNVGGANNFGFLTPQRFELTADGYRIQGRAPGRTMVIGVFGGSFAQQFAMATAPLLEEIMRKASPGREPTVVNFAMEGHAIPQTAFAFLYFRSMVDVALFLDGYNELWNYVNNNRAGCPPEYAKAAHYRFKTSAEELTPASLSRTVRLAALRARVRRVTEWSLRSPWRHSALVHVVWTRLVRHFERAINAESAVIEREFEAGEPFMAASDSEIVRIAARQWGAYHRMIHTVAASEGIVVVHAVQPNIYVPDSKERLTSREREILHADEGTPRGECLRLGYPLLLQEAAALRRCGARTVDLTGVFAHCVEERWIDVCHTNEAGYREVADRILVAMEHLSQTTGTVPEDSCAG